MAFPTDDILLGPRSYGARRGHEGVVYHTTEGAGPSRDAAVATARMQSPGGSLYAGGGSYNFIVYDGGCLLTVPFLESSGGLSTKRTDPPWHPASWLATMLSAPAYSDPNAYMLQIAFSGKAADLAAGKYPANMIDTAAKLLIWFENSAFGKNNAVVSGHADWQSNRTDPGAGVVQKILARYDAIKNPPAPTPPPDYQKLYNAEKVKSAALAAQVTSLNAKVTDLTTRNTQLTEALRVADARIAAAKTALG